MEEVALGQLFFRYCHHFAVLHIHFHANSTNIMRTSGQDLGIFKQSGVQILGSIDKEVLYVLIVVCVCFFFFIPHVRRAGIARVTILTGL